MKTIKVTMDNNNVYQVNTTDYYKDAFTLTQFVTGMNKIRIHCIKSISGEYLIASHIASIKDNDDRS